MELFLPQQIALNETSKALIGDVEETARRVNEYRPLPAAVVKRIEDSLMGERVYSSNAIEGNTLDLRETETVLKQGIASTKKRRDAVEARNLAHATRRISEMVAEGPSAHTLERLLEAHKLILHETPDEDWGGRFREERVKVTGAKYQPPDHTIVPGLVERVLRLLGSKEEIPGLLKASWGHWALARIHPFKDGNGRISRLWQDLVLFQENLTCAIITPEQRREYLNALTNADDGDFNNLVQLIAQRVAMTFDRYLTELDQETEATAFVRELVGEADARVDEHRRLDYQRWARQMERLRWEFETCSARVTEASKAVSIQMTKYDMVDQARWENIRKGLPAERTWFFILNFDSPKRRRRYYFYFAKHYWSPELDNRKERSENRVCLLISEHDEESGKGEPLDRIIDCGLAVREIFLVNDAFVVRRHDRGQADMTYDRGVSPMRIAQDFVRDVILHRLT